MVANLTILPTSAGYTEQWGMDSISFTPMFGASRIRRMGIGDVPTITLTWILPLSDYNSFRTFYITTIAGGSLPFTLSLSGVTKTLQFVGGLQNTGVDGTTYTVTGTLEVLS